MRRTILFLTILLFAVSVFGQEEEKEKQLFPFEVTISINRTNISSPGSKNRFGCGASLSESVVLVEQLDFLFGVEYNYTSLFVDYIPGGMHYLERDMTLYIHAFSLPVALRFSIGKNVKYFIEPGIFLDFMLYSQKKGYGYLINPRPTPEDPWDIKEFKVNERADISGINFGTSFGMGMRIPMKGIEWVVKADYKFGLNTFEVGNLNFYNQYYRLSVGIRKNSSYKKL